MNAVMSVRQLAEDQSAHQQNHHDPTIQGRCLHAYTVARQARARNSPTAVAARYRLFELCSTMTSARLRTPSFTNM
jgi:hypothetical protein